MRSFSRLAAVSVIAVMSAFVAGSAAASSWMYNGSKVSLEEDGSKRRIVFAEPKAGLDKSGIKRGTVLFEGETKKNGRISGYAKLFKAGCDPLDYFVEGSADSSKGEIVLQGQAPVFSSEGCKIKGYSEDSSASTLSFSSLGGGRGNYADRGYEQGDGGSDRNGGRNAQTDPRTGQGYDNRSSNGQYGNGQRDGYASNGNERYDSRQGATVSQGSSNSQSDNRYDNRNGGRNEDPRYGSRNSQGQYGQQDDGAYDNRDPQQRNYAERGSSNNDGQEYDPRYDRADPQDDPDSEYYERRTYRYRTYRRPYYPDWREGTGR